MLHVHTGSDLQYGGASFHDLMSLCRKVLCLYTLHWNPPFLLLSDLHIIRVSLFWFVSYDDFSFCGSFLVPLRMEHRPCLALLCCRVVTMTSGIPLLPSYLGSVHSINLDMCCCHQLMISPLAESLIVKW